MDELKLEKWRQNFKNEVQNMQIEFDGFFKNKKIDKYYELILDESSELSLKVNNELPQQLKERLEQLLINTKPEDSI